uniref:Uncharacterized protein MANES_10G110000 n=1 Tax=Rhizophora mucronata TaxID=61149 RepID=A0A2P2JMF9_RHIMU
MWNVVPNFEDTTFRSFSAINSSASKYAPNSFYWQGNGWKVVASFEGNFPNRIKQLPLDRHFDLNNVKRVNNSFLHHTTFLPFMF